MILFYGASLFTGNVLRLFLLPSHNGFYNLSCEVRFIYRRSTAFFFISAQFLWQVPYCHFHFVIWFVLPINPIMMIRWNRRNAYGRQKSQQFTVELKYRIFNRFFFLGWNRCYLRYCFWWKMNPDDSKWNILMYFSFNIEMNSKRKHFAINYNQDLVFVEW